MENNLPLFLTPPALAYTWRQLARRAGVTNGDPNRTGFEALNIPLFYGHPDQFDLDKPGLIVVPAPPAAQHKLLSLAPNSLTWLPADRVMPAGQPLPVESTTPVLFWGQGYEDEPKLFAERLSNASIIFYADIIAAAFFMLSRWEETVIEDRDEHARFPATASVAYRQGFLNRPIVDEYALILRAWLKIIRPGWEPEVRHFSVKLSHDIDRIRRFWNLKEAIRTLGGDLLKRRSPGRAWHSCIEAVTQTVAPQQTANWRGIYTLAELSGQYGLKSAFYFMTTDPDPLENDYDLTSPPMRRVIEAIHQQGFEIGFHPGYRTLNDVQKLAAEKARLDAVLGKTCYGGRQHYLRFQAPNTWRHWEQVGLRYDSTLAYADCEGFRCGTCHPFHPFDLEQKRELHLWEWPLVIMDKTLKDYRGLSPEEGERTILALAHKCKQVGGVFTLLWHNSSLSGKWRPWAEVYRRVVAALAKLQA